MSRSEHLGGLGPGKLTDLHRLLAVDRTFPRIICLCGSTRFKEAWQAANLQLTLAGYIVLAVGSFTHSDDELSVTDEKKIELDILHKRKIDLADAVVVLNVHGYIGSSTQSEIKYATDNGKPVRYLEGATGKQDVVGLVDQLFKAKK